MTKSTIVSIVPTKVKVDMAGALYPSLFEIPKADDLMPEVLIVEDAKTRIYLGTERGYFTTTILSAELAQAIAHDYVQSCICYAPPDCSPGIFAMPDQVITKNDVEKVCKVELAQARRSQRAWYEALIKMADDDWAKSGHMHRSISNLQRDIAKKLRLEKEWLFIPEGNLPHGMIKCPACKTAIEPDVILCPNCKLILKPEEHKKLVFA